jgi:hypothetical protein
MCRTILLLLVMLSACNDKHVRDNSFPVTIDNNLSKDIVFAAMEKQKEVTDHYYYKEMDAKRTSFVCYGILDSESKCDSNFNCIAYYWGDSLRIDIGMREPWRKWGFSIRYKNQKCEVRPFFEDIHSVPMDQKTKSEFSRDTGSLVLDKRVYEPGDSLFGKISFRLQELMHITARTQITRTQIADGYFRCKIMSYK